MTNDISNCKSWLEAWNIYYGPEKEMEPEDQMQKQEDSLKKMLK